MSVYLSTSVSGRALVNKTTHSSEASSSFFSQDTLSILATAKKKGLAKIRAELLVNVAE